MSCRRVDSTCATNGVAAAFPLATDNNSASLDLRSLPGRTDRPLRSLSDNAETWCVSLTDICGCAETFHDEREYKVVVSQMARETVMELAVLTAMNCVIVLDISGYQWSAMARDFRAARS